MKTLLKFEFNDTVDLNTLAYITAIEEQAAKCRKEIINYLVKPSVSPKPTGLTIEIQ